MGWMAIIYMGLTTCNHASFRVKTWEWILLVLDMV